MCCTRVARLFSGVLTQGAPIRSFTSQSPQFQLHKQFHTSKHIDGSILASGRAGRPKLFVCATAAAVLATTTSSPSPPPPHYADFPLDRAGHLRTQPDALSALLEDPSTRILIFYENKALVVPRNEDQLQDGVLAVVGLRACSFAPANTEAPDGGPPRWVPLVCTPQEPLWPDINSRINAGSGLIFLGLKPQGSAVFACELETLPDEISKALLVGEEGEQGGEGRAPKATFISVRTEGQLMTGPDAALLGHTVGLLQWHTAAGFNSRTGEQTKPSAGGHARVNISGKGRATYPRVDPAVIVAVTWNDWLLLGRKQSWVPGRYSLLAGFSETGETLEAAVAREVLEESGVVINIGSVQYHSSQPWPFPQSLMVGFWAEAETPEKFSQSSSGLEVLPEDAQRAAREVGLLPEEAERYILDCPPRVTVDPNELEDARWFHKSWLNSALRGDIEEKKQKETQGGEEEEEIRGVSFFRIPGRYALANRIISDWLDAAPTSISTSPSWSGDAIPDVTIDNGVFKYVLLRVISIDGVHSKLIVRGHAHTAYHNHLFSAAKKEISAIDAQLQVETVGGGRIEHLQEQRVVTVYGYSAAFGQAPHDVTAAVLQRGMPLCEVVVRYDGY